VDRKKKRKNQVAKSLDKSFYWMESINRKRCWTRTFMMNFMDNRIDFWKMHKAMSPIKPSVVKKNNKKTTYYKPDDSVFIYIAIEQSVSIFF
jgi:hypothetical protein